MISVLRHIRLRNLRGPVIAARTAVGLFAATLGVNAVLSREAVAGSAEPLVVVELFTSQGCVSCPPADAFLSEIAQRKGILALSLHVDYWNYMGWKDPFSSPQMSKRQKQYSKRLGQRYVYTPQMVIDGRVQEVGANREAVEALLADARRAIDEKLPLHVYRGGANEVKIVLPAWKGKNKDDNAKFGTLWLVAFDEKHTTEISAGENRGKMLSNANVVRALRPVATWNGKAQSVMLNLASEIAAGYGQAAVLLQANETGPVLATARVTMPVGESEN